jgi:ABC-2 type transport system permease protein
MRILATIYKELLLLLRDKAGFAMIFIMPITLVVVMSLIQDAPFRDYQEIPIDIVFIDEDKDSIGIWMRQTLSSAKNITLVDSFDGLKLTDSLAALLVNNGKFKSAIIIPSGTTKSLNKKVSKSVRELLLNFGMGEKVNDTTQLSATEVRVIFDPVTKSNFKTSITNAVEKIAANAQSQLLVSNLKTQLIAMGLENKNKPIEFGSFLSVEEIEPFESDLPVTNSVQHNVPAWTMFAMFLILFPPAGNLIKEREEGSLLRLRLIAGSELPVIGGKYLFYFLICLIQFVFMVAVGIYFLPLLGLPKLVLGSNILGVILVATTVAAAATAYGLFIGVFFKTYHQALTFGSVSVVLLAAIGGVWVPTYIMPPVLKMISQFSPMAWGLDAFNELFLRNATTEVLYPFLIRLSFFAIVFLLLAVFFYKRRMRA